jgi:hypothetical protein
MNSSPKAPWRTTPSCTPTIYRIGGCAGSPPVPSRPRSRRRRERTSSRLPTWCFRPRSRQRSSPWWSLEVPLFLVAPALELTQLLLLGSPFPFVCGGLVPDHLTLSEIDEPLVPQVADDARRDLQLLDDLAQLTPMVEQVENPRREVAFRKRRRDAGHHALGLERSHLRGVEHPASGLACRVQDLSLHLPDREDTSISELGGDLGAGEPPIARVACFLGLLLVWIGLRNGFSGENAGSWAAARRRRRKQRRNQRVKQGQSDGRSSTARVYPPAGSRPPRRRASMNAARSPGATRIALRTRTWGS